METVPLWRRVQTFDILPDDTVIATTRILTFKEAIGEVRVGLVAYEVKLITGDGTRVELLAAAPPSEAFKTLITIAASNRTYVLDFIDVKKTDFNGISERRVVVKLTNEAGEDFVVLCRTLYGRSDAANACKEYIREMMIEYGFEPGKSTP